MFPTCPAVELIEPKLLPAHVVPRSRLVLHVYPKIYILLGSKHLRADGEQGERREQAMKQKISILDRKTARQPANGHVAQEDSDLAALYLTAAAAVSGTRHVILARAGSQQ